MTYAAGSNGSLTGTTSQTVDHGSGGSAVTPVPSSGYEFVNWSDGTTTNPRTDTNITANLSVSANFQLTNPDANANGILDPWEITVFGNADPGNNAPGDDPDNDGLSNFLEYALNTHPLQPNASPIVHDLVTVGADKHLRLTILKNPAATNLVYQVEVSSDLTGPSWSGTQTTVENETASELRARDNLTTDSAPHRFIRLKVRSN